MRFHVSLAMLLLSCRAVKFPRLTGAVPEQLVEDRGLDEADDMYMSPIDSFSCILDPTAVVRGLTFQGWGRYQKCENCKPRYLHMAKVDIADFVVDASDRDAYYSPKWRMQNPDLPFSLGYRFIDGFKHMWHADFIEPGLCMDRCGLLNPSNQTCLADYTEHLCTCKGIQKLLSCASAEKVGAEARYLERMCFGKWHSAGVVNPMASLVEMESCLMNVTKCYNKSGSEGNFVVLY